MTAQIRNGTKVIAEADDRNGVLAVYKYLNPTHLVYPKDPFLVPSGTQDENGNDILVPGPVSEIHIRIPDEDGQYTNHEPTILTVSQIEETPDA